MELVNTPFNYTGSKFKLLPQLLPHFDYTKKTFVDVFAGGGSVYANIVDKYDKIIINDIIKDLVECHKLLGENDPNFVGEVKFYSVGRDEQLEYHKLRDDYNISPSAAKLFALMLCCTNNMLRFNKSFKFNQTFGKRTFNVKTQEKINGFINQVYPFKDKIEYKSIEFDMLSIDNDMMVYLDPPYAGKIHKEAGYNAYYSVEKDLKLFEYCVKINDVGGSFCLSNTYNEDTTLNAPVVTRLISSGFNIIKLNGNYDKVSRNKSKIKMDEIIIKNY